MTQQVNLRLFRAEMAPGLRLYAARAQGEHATFAAWLRNIRSEVIRDGLDDGDGEANGSPLQKGDRIVRPSGGNGPAYRTTENFQVIVR